MKNALYPKLDIEGLEYYHFEPYKCVYGALKFKYGALIITNISRIY